MQKFEPFIAPILMTLERLAPAVHMRTDDVKVCQRVACASHAACTHTPCVTPPLYLAHMHNAVRCALAAAAANADWHVT